MGWKRKEQQLFRIITEEEYNSIDNGEFMITHYLDMANQIISALTRRVLDCTTTNIYSFIISFRTNKKYQSTQPSN